MAFVPYVANLEKWKKHFVHMAEGKASSNDGMYIIGKTVQTGNGKDDEPVVNYVTPTAQAVEQAQSEMSERKTTTKRKIKSKSGISSHARRRVNTNNWKK